MCPIYFVLAERGWSSWHERKRMNGGGTSLRMCIVVSKAITSEVMADRPQGTLAAALPRASLW